MAVVLVVGAGLMIKGNYRAARVDLGIDAGQGISFTTFLPEQGYPDSAAILRFQDRLAEQLRAIPKVETVGFGSTLPFDGSSRTPYSVDAPAADSARDLAYAQLHSVSDGYFGALGIKVSRGRPFAAIDHFGAPWVALVNERLAAVHWPGADPVGHRLWFRDRDWTVVGVVANVREWGVLDEAPAAIYVAASQSPTRWVSFAVRAQRGIDQLGPEARAAVAAVAPRQPIARLQSLAWQATRARREPRLLAEMFGLLGAIAILGCPQPTGQPRAAPASRPCRS